MAADFKTSPNSVKRSIRDQGFKAYKRIPVQKLKPDHVPQRKQCCTWIRKHLRLAHVQNMMFSDEKVFTSNGYYNPKNDVVYAESRADANEAGAIFEFEKYPIKQLVALGANWNGLSHTFLMRVKG